jgi:hypothetical protein
LNWSRMFWGSATPEFSSTILHKKVQAVKHGEESYDAKQACLQCHVILGCDLSSWCPAPPTAGARHHQQLVPGTTRKAYMLM